MHNQVWLGTVVAAAALLTQRSAPWHDPSPHDVRFVRVYEGVQLEVLDWGGAGTPIVLLAGLGNTAHVFDEFAPKLVRDGHVYGITRRGFGSSSWPEAGYTSEWLAEDVFRVLDSLRLTGAVLVGHSVAGQELTTLGARRSDRIAGLVYLDAAADDLTGIESDPRLQAIRRKLPLPRPSASDRKSFPALRNWWIQTHGIALPEAELRSLHDLGQNGGVGKYRAANWASTAIMEGVQKPNYHQVRVPALAIYAMPRSPRDVPPWLKTEDPAMLAAFEEGYAYGVAALERSTKAFQSGIPNARIVKLPGANHYVFLSNEEDVLRELRSFLASLR